MKIHGMKGISVQECHISNKRIPIVVMLFPVVILNYVYAALLIMVQLLWLNEPLSWTGLWPFPQSI